MLIIPDLLGMGHSVLPVLNRGTVLVTWRGGPRPCLALIWTSTCWPAWTSQVTSVISLKGEMIPQWQCHGLLSNQEHFAWA